MDSIASRLIALAKTHFGDKAASLRAEDDFFDVLDINSMQALDLLTEIEDEFDVEVPDYEMQDVRTMNGLAELIARRGG